MLIANYVSLWYEIYIIIISYVFKKMFSNMGFNRGRGVNELVDEVVYAKMMLQ